MKYINNIFFIFLAFICFNLKAMSENENLITEQKIRHMPVYSLKTIAALEIAELIQNQKVNIGEVSKAIPEELLEYVNYFLDINQYIDQHLETINKNLEKWKELTEQSEYSKTFSSTEELQQPYNLACCLLKVHFQYLGNLKPLVELEQYNKMLKLIRKTKKNFYLLIESSSKHLKAFIATLKDDFLANNPILFLKGIKLLLKKELKTTHTNSLESLKNKFQKTHVWDFKEEVILGPFISQAFIFGASSIILLFDLKIFTKNDLLYFFEQACKLSKNIDALKLIKSKINFTKEEFELLITTTDLLECCIEQKDLNILNYLFQLIEEFEVTIYYQRNLLKTAINSGISHHDNDAFNVTAFLLEKSNQSDRLYAIARIQKLYDNAIGLQKKCHIGQLMSHLLLRFRQESLTFNF